jgi:hypothetical protein
VTVWGYETGGYATTTGCHRPHDHTERTESVTTLHPDQLEFARQRPGRWVARTERADYLAIKADGSWHLHVLVAASRCVSSPPLRSRDEAAAIAAAHLDRADDDSPTAEARLRFAIREGLRRLYPRASARQLRR